MTTPDTGESPLVGVERSIRLYLNDLKFKQTGRDPKNGGFAYAEVPDWALRQWLNRIEIAQRGISISGSEDDQT